MPPRRGDYLDAAGRRLFERCVAGAVALVLLLLLLAVLELLGMLRPRPG